ncbi:M23 family metallopeptidase [Nocardia takedensis]|uniref:M23 family metallopeptidase n=1 Tax=Nocardia takedensis TaxID=259390 RepID=UPI000315EC64|nr:M23 family metallopeptidase [Nocardia takedensis]
MTDPEHDNDDAGAGGGWTWLAAAIPVLLLGAIVAALAGDREEPEQGCLPNIPNTPAGQGASVVWPIAAAISSPFGPRDGEFHHGADFAAPLGAEIVSATSGTVVAAGPADGFGNWIVVDTRSDATGSGTVAVSAVYGHMREGGIKVRIGQSVTAGTPIAEVGDAGQSSGPHLHFEIVPGGRLSGGAAIDPIPWLTEHAGPRPDTSAGPGAPALVAHASDTGPALGPARNSEAHLQRRTVHLLRALEARFPQITRFETWRPSDPFPDHPDGRAVDAMIPGYDTPEGRALGDEVVAYAHAHAKTFGLVYTLWRLRYTPVEGDATTMAATGDPTTDHVDHVHLTVTGGGAPAPDQTYTAPTETSMPARSGCDPAGPVAAATPIAAGTVPEAFAPWIAKAAGTCPQVGAPLIAAQLENESGFRVDAHNARSGATGPAQFLPSTWEAKAVDGDGDGRRDPHSIPDAVMSQAAYDCELAAIATDALAEGRLHGDLTQLWLSMYNCGPGATLGTGGVCQNRETLAYVRDIPERATHFASATPGGGS